MRRSRNWRSHRIQIHFSYTFLVLKATSQMEGIGNNGRGQPEQWIRNGLFRLRFADVIITFKMQTFTTVSPRFLLSLFSHTHPSDSMWAAPVFAQEHVPDCDVRHHSMVCHSNGRALFSIFVFVATARPRSILFFHHLSSVLASAAFHLPLFDHQHNFNFTKNIYK